jgi:hypothetical protein
MANNEISEDQISIEFYNQLMTESMGGPRSDEHAEKLLRACHIGFALLSYNKLSGPNLGDTVQLLTDLFPSRAMELPTKISMYRQFAHV